MPYVRKLMRKRSLFLSALLAVTLSPLSLTVAMASNAQEKLGSVETIIVGGKNSMAPIEERIKSLEIKVFGKVQPGNLAARLSALEKFAGCENSSDAMPAAAPPIHKVEHTAGRTVGKRVAEIRTAKKNGEPLDARLEAAVKLHHDGKTSEAEQSLKKILEENPKNADAFFSLGAIAESRGDLRAALEYYTTAMQYNPNDSESKDAVADLSRRLTAQQNTAEQPVFSNPFAATVPPPEPSAPGVPFLQGRAWDVNANANANATVSPPRGHAPLSVTLPTVPTANVTQNGRPNTFARALTRAALGAALSGTGLHCPMCHILNGF